MIQKIVIFRVSVSLTNSGYDHDFYVKYWTKVFVMPL